MDNNTHTLKGKNTYKYTGKRSSFYLRGGGRRGAPTDLYLYRLACNSLIIQRRPVALVSIYSMDIPQMFKPY